MYNDTEAFGWHHVVLKINNRSCRPGVDHLGRQLTIKQGTTTSSASYLRKLDWATSTICKHVNCCTNAINESFDKYRPLRFPTLLHLTVGYYYTLEYRTPLCSTSSNRKTSSRSGPHRDPSALTPHLWINTELCTQPQSKQNSKYIRLSLSLNPYCLFLDKIALTLNHLLNTNWTEP